MWKISKQEYWCFKKKEIWLEMGCIFFAKEPMAIVHGMDSYFTQTQPECSVYSEDHNEFPIHKGNILWGVEKYLGATWYKVQFC